MIWSFILLIPICAFYLLWEFNVVKNATVMDLMKDFVDISPAVILLVFNRPWCAAFLMLCLMANEFIYDNWAIGGVLFAAAYGSASVLASSMVPFNGWYILLAAVAMAVVAVPIAILYKGKAILKIGACSYSALALAPCVYALCATRNPGFLLLVLGDIGLGVYGITDNKYVKAGANLLYFAGTCLVPLSL